MLTRILNTVLKTKTVKLSIKIKSDFGNGVAFFVYTDSFQGFLYLFSTELNMTFSIVVISRLAFC